MDAPTVDIDDKEVETAADNTMPYCALTSLPPCLSAVQAGGSTTAQEAVSLQELEDSYNVDIRTT